MKYFLLLFLISTLACVHGKKTEQKSPLNYLNGEHYQETGTVMGVPIIHQNDVATVVKGQLLFDSKPLPTSLRNQKLVLISGKWILQETISGNDGLFQFKGVFKKGSYEIQLQSDKYSATFPLEINSYEISGIKVLAIQK